MPLAFNTFGNQIRSDIHQSKITKNEENFHLISNILFPFQFYEFNQRPTQRVKQRTYLGRTDFFRRLRKGV
jgi:hypothetical protein